MLWIW